MLDKLRIWTISRLGGFSTVQEAIDSIEDQKTKNEILTRAVRRLFNTIGASDILKQNSKGQWLLEGKIISEARKTMLITEAIGFIQSNLWDIMQLDINYQANKMMFTHSKTELDIVSGKLWLYTLDTIRTRLKSMSEGKGSFNSK